MIDVQVNYRRRRRAPMRDDARRTYLFIAINAIALAEVSNRLSPRPYLQALCIMSSTSHPRRGERERGGEGGGKRVGRNTRNITRLAKDRRRRRSLSSYELLRVPLIVTPFMCSRLPLHLGATCYLGSARSRVRKVTRVTDARVQCPARSAV